MEQLFFWNTWQRPYRQIYWGLISLLLVAVVFFVISWISGADIAFPWETYAQAETITTRVDTINAGPFSLPLEVQNYLLTESFQGGHLTLYKWPSYIFAIILAAVFTLTITCVSALTRFWYLMGMGLIIAFLMSLQLENLHLFGTINKTALIIFFVSYIPLSYYYQSINSGVLFSTRLIFFSLITCAMALMIYFGAEVRYPFLQLTTHAYVAPIIITLLFILMISHQLLTGFVYVITKNNNAYSKNSLSHFLIITSVYLVNLLIVVLNQIQFLHWDLFNIHPFVLLLISSVIGILLYSYREETYKHIYRFYPIGGFLYVMLGIICFFTIGYYLFTANDAVIEVVQDMILYAHFGYGLMFLIYILANFLNPLGNNQQVYKVLYKPAYMPYFTYRFAGTIVTIAFVLVSNYQVPLFHTMAGYYNTIADMHYQLGDDKVAKVYYRKAAIYDYRSHHAHYTLGILAREDGDNAQAAYHFNEAIQKRPTPQSFINLGNIYLEEGKFFDGLFTIRDGLDHFPENDRIKINLGLQYAKADEPDSALLIFNAARNKSLTARSASVNILAMISRSPYAYDPDSLIDEYVTEQHHALKTNALALANTRQKYWDTEFTTDSVLNLITGYALSNASINQLFGDDSLYIAPLSFISDIPGNTAYKEKLHFALALGYYYHQEVEQAFRLLDQLASSDPHTTGYYHYVLGLLSLDQEAPRLAVDFFRKAQLNSYPQADLALAVAATEAGLIHEAMLYWEELSASADPLVREVAISASEILQLSDTLISNDPGSIYWYWKYQISKEDELRTAEVLNKSDPHTKAKIYQDLMTYCYSIADTARFVKCYLAAKAEYDNESIKLGWQSLVKADLESTIGEMTFEEQKDAPPADRTRICYYKARAAELKQDTLAARKLFDKVAANPFFESGVIGQSNFLNNRGEKMAAYNTLLGALEINPYAVNLRKQYILQCADMDFERYGDYALEELRPLVSGQDYMLFKTLYGERLQASREAFEYLDEE